jgi:hypothetical protein
MVFPSCLALSYLSHSLLNSDLHSAGTLFPMCSCRPPSLLCRCSAVAEIPNRFATFLDDSPAAKALFISALRGLEHARQGRGINRFAYWICSRM